MTVVNLNTEETTEKIFSFIAGEKVLTLATSENNIPYCACCYYALDEENKKLFFLSDSSTKHMQQALANNQVAGSIFIDPPEIEKIKGIQFTGAFYEPRGKDETTARRIYVEKYPFAAGTDEKIWGIELTQIKMTDNSIGIGKKIHWSRETRLTESS